MDSWTRFPRALKYNVKNSSCAQVQYYLYTVIAPGPAGTAKLHGDDLGIVVEAVYGARYKWYGIGLQLGLVPSVLEGIEQQYSGTEDRLRVLLTHWLKQVDPVPSWVTLIEALRSKTVSELRLAKQLEKYYILPHSKCTFTIHIL